MGKPHSHNRHRHRLFESTIVPLPKRRQQLPAWPTENPQREILKLPDIPLKKPEKAKKQLQFLLSNGETRLPIQTVTENLAQQIKKIHARARRNS